MVNSALFITRFYNEEHITWRGYVIGFELFFFRACLNFPV